MSWWPQRIEGATAFLVPAGSPGFKLGHRDKTLGMRGVQVHPLYLNDVVVPADMVLGSQAVLKPFSTASTTSRDWPWRPSPWAALTMPWSWALTSPSNASSSAWRSHSKGAIQAFIADSAVEVETLRSQIYRCASLAEQDKLDGEAASIAKLWANRVAYQVANRMIQTHGGYGYILDYAIGRVFRDCRTIEGIEGSNRSQQNRYRAQHA